MVFGCGLMTNQEEPVPLKSIEVGVQVKDHVATVSSTLQYENKEDRPLEAVFVFPLPGEAAVCHFSATVGQTEVVAKVQEKQKAREEYDDALSSGEQAFLLEESDQSPDVFTLSVGSLPPGEGATIRLEYVTELAVQADDGLRLCLPAVLNPRYQPQGCDPGNAKVTSVPASAVPYSLSVSADISSPRLISKVESNCLLEPLKHLNKDQTHATVSLAAGHKFDRDFELLIYYKDSHLPSAVVEAAQTTAEPGTLMGDAVVMLSLYPEFPEEVMCGEFLFVIDRSGSMVCQIGSGEGRQDRIGSARDTLLLLLKSLPMGCYFNIYGFGSTYDHIFPKSVEYSQKTMDDAMTKVKNMSADLGGTEIMEPLKHIYSQPCLPSQPRQLFVFTDGAVGNTKEVLDLVRRNAGSHRCFTFGIGEGASSALINGMAKEGGGHAQFITGADRMQPKVMQSLRFALQPAVVNISVKWDVPRGVSVTLLSPPITTLFQGQRSLLYAQLTGNSSGDTEGSVTVKYSLAEQPFKNRLCFRLKPTDDTGLTVHRLGARTKIRSLEMEARETEGLKKKVVALSVQSGVSSTFTAFIAVNKGSGKVLQGPLVRRNIPTATDSSRRSYLMSPSVIGCSMASQPKMLRKVSAAEREREERPSDPSPQLTAGGKKTTFSKRFQLLKVFRKKAVPVDMLYNEAQCVLPQEACLDIDYASIECNGEDKDPVVSEPIVEPLLRLISLQKASGSWVLEPALAEVLGKTSEEMAKPKPAQVNQEVWATVLALIWLHGFKMDAKDEWELLAMKAASWVQAQKVPNVTEFVEAGNTLLGCKVQRNTLGI